MMSRKHFTYLCLVLAIVGAVVVGIIGRPGAEDNSASVVYDSAGNSWIGYQDETNGDPKQTDVALKWRLNSPPNQPSNSLPANGSAGISLAALLQSSAFSDPDAGDTHAASQWQITSVYHNYSSSVFDSSRDTLNLTGITVPLGKLQAAKTYYWHVRHQDSHGVWSIWSAETLFTTASPQPTVTGVSPSQGIQGQTLNVTVTGTNFSGATGVNFDPEITVNSFTVNDSTRITVVVRISAAAAPGSSSVSVTAPKGSGTLTNGFNVYRSPQAGFSASATAVSLGETVTFTNLSSGGIPLLSYAWDFDGNGPIDSTNPNPTYSHAMVGTYTASLKMTDSRGNSDTETKTGYVTVSKAIEPHDITPQDVTAVTTTNGRIATIFPAGAATGDATVTIEQISPSSAEKAPEGFKMGSSYFTIEAADASGKAIFAFSKLVTITVKYSDEDLAAAGGAPENLVLANYNEATGKWNIVETTLNKTDRSLSATTTHFSTWAILVKTSSGGLALWIRIVIGLAAALAVGAVLVKSVAVELLNRAP
jgi:PKD repeat protein